MTETKPFKNLNKALLLRIKQKILAEPEKFHMANWAVVDGDRVYSGAGLVDTPVYGAKVGPRCGTTCCIAGWAWVLTRKSPDQAPQKLWKNFTEEGACKLLGIDSRGEDHGELFVVGLWPEQYKAAYLKARSPKGRARAAARYIDYLVKG